MQGMEMGIPRYGEGLEARSGATEHWCHDDDLSSTSQSRWVVMMHANHRFWEIGTWRAS